MRVFSSLALFCAIFAGAEPVFAAQNRAQVMVLGVAHLVARRDVHNSVFTDSPLSPRRQAQIADVIAHLARFHPTKVLIEATMGDPKYAQRYALYRTGKYTLSENEIYQFGFKLAAGAGDDTIYPVDTDGPQYIDPATPSGKRIYAWLKQHFNDVQSADFDAFLKRSDSLELHGTYLDLLRYLNTGEAIHANAGWYSAMDGLGRSADFAGSAYTAQWYARNCYIFSNILSVIRPGDRVVVIMGQGHEYLLREFVRLNPNLAYVNPLQYLR